MSQSEQASDKKELDANAQSASRVPLILLVVLVALGIGTAFIYGCLNSLSWQFTYESVFKERPLIPVLVFFAVAFVLYVAAVEIARRAKQTGLLIGVIVGFAVLFRIVMVFSYPIQEVDIYRYMWDGEVQTQGVSPFKFSPEEVFQATVETEKPDLRKLAVLCKSDPSVKEVLRRVHYRELPTIYPPTSQLVFRAVSMISPTGEWVLQTDDPELRKEQTERAVNQRLLVMKAVLIAFDLGVLILLIGILALCRMPVGLSVAYGWCPLVMKEVANGGHLDAIAVFLSVLAIYLLVRLISQPASETGNNRGSSSGFLLSVLAALVLAAAVGAKLYPIVLAPLVFAGIARRRNWPATIAATIAFVSAAILLLLPILPLGLSEADAKREAAVQAVAVAAEQLAAGEKLPADEQLASAERLPAVKQLIDRTGASQPDFEDDPSAGLTKFLKTWEMNDFIFMITVENLKVNPNDEVNPNQLPMWFSVVPPKGRRLIVDPVLKGHNIRLAELQQKFQETQQRQSTARQQITGPAEVKNVERRIAEIKAGIYQKEAENIWQQINDVNASIYETPFKITRVLTSIVFLILALWFVWRAGSKAASSDGSAIGRFYCEAAFLTLAWFWLLLPTQNPWYWLWALPFLPFVRNRAWLAVSGIILVYYFRFWMEYHFPGIAVWGTPYQGVAFFDFVLTWFEFAPWFIWLAIEGVVWLVIDSVKKRRKAAESMVATSSS